MVQADASVQEAVGSGSWVDTVPLFPQTFTEADVSALLSASPAVKQALASGAQVLAGTCVVSKGLLDVWRERAEGLGRDAALAAAVAKVSKGPAAPVVPAPAVPAVRAEAADDDWSVGVRLCIFLCCHLLAPGSVCMRIGRLRLVLLQFVAFVSPEMPTGRMCAASDASAVCSLYRFTRCQNDWQHTRQDGNGAQNNLKPAPAAPAVPVATLRCQCSLCSSSRGHSRHGEQ